MAVGLAFRHIVGADGAVGARLVLDDDVLAQARLELVGDEPRHHIGRPAGRKGDDDADDAGREVLRGGRRGEPGQRRQRQGKNARQSSQMRHRRLPVVLLLQSGS